MDDPRVYTLPPLVILILIMMWVIPAVADLVIKGRTTRGDEAVPERIAGRTVRIMPDT